jgi:very-short-patch-repair endonuclease
MTYKLNYPTTKEQHQYLRERQKEQLQKSKTSKAELWMFEKLNQTGLKWTRQAIWGYRLFDFWCHDLKIAIEVDGPEHNKNYDSFRDKYNLNRSNILVLRVRNFNEDDAQKALKAIEVFKTI